MRVPLYPCDYGYDGYGYVFQTLYIFVFFFSSFFCVYSAMKIDYTLVGSRHSAHHLARE